MATDTTQHLRRVRALALAEIANLRDDAAATLEAWQLDRIALPDDHELAELGGEADDWRELTKPQRRAIAQRVGGARAEGLDALGREGMDFAKWYGRVAVLIAADRVAAAAARPGTIDLAACPALGGASVDDHLAVDVTGDGGRVRLSDLFGKTDAALEVLAELDQRRTDRAWDQWAHTVLEIVDDHDAPPSDAIADAIAKSPALMGTLEIAKAAGVAYSTAASWWRRGHLPEPRQVLSCGPIWNGADIYAWMARRDRDDQGRIIAASSGPVRARRRTRTAVGA